MKLPRTLLFVPADRPERLPKALAAGAVQVIVDLEDAVAPHRKREARDALAAALDAACAPVAVRINGADSPEFADDLALCRHPGVVAVVVPKAEDPALLAQVAAAAPQAMLLPLIETARGIASTDALAGAPRVQRLVFGSIDLQLDLGLGGGDEELLVFRMRLVLVSRLAGLAAPVDGVTTTLDDVETLREDALRARRLGFGAKLCIHPRQVPVVEAAFTPSAEERAWAQRVLAAAEAAQGAAVAVDGRMVDRPVIARARALLA
ncbi:CoA ester lyase [Piscinibacter sp. HJYY11]|uniref:HpcH/HpaI aldolase/citrate lyase family protein n=1 Tax=Piscinibacter sp. HJYY11 TaxID=2801333 RepID=UPI00191FE73C|nr:CoA ester lyase [Piscinibacter sp. HJYY11]MBL0730678.1 CoA ester lyase [Piscinibacter sp. HJYY11]